MIIDADFIKVLKNFSRINNSIFIAKESHQVNTVSSAKNILGKYIHTNEPFPVDVCIYDLTKLINVLNTYETFELDFTEQYLLIINGKEKSKFFFADPEIIVRPSKDIVMPTVSVSFSLTNELIERIFKMSSSLGVSDICFTTNDKSELIVQVLDGKNVSSNSHEIVVGESPSKGSFDYQFSVDNLKIIPGDYQVSLTDRIISQFKHTSLDLTYWIAMNTQTRAIPSVTTETHKSNSSKQKTSSEVDELSEDDIPF